jgi:hypothetical protein
MDGGVDGWVHGERETMRWGDGVGGVGRMSSSLILTTHHQHSSLITHHSFLSCRYGDALDNRKLDFGQRFRDVDGDCFSRVVAGQYESMFNSRQMLSMNLLGALAALLCVPLLSCYLVSGRFSLRSPQRVLFSLVCFHSCFFSFCLKL